jgi:DNA-binding CsgD family transcriptional regulator
MPRVVDSDPERARANRLASIARANAATQRRIATGGLTRRHMRIVLLHLAGHTDEEIAKQVGLANRDVVSRIRRGHPCQKELDRIIMAQRERIIAGEFGVQAQAKAASPKAMKVVTDQLGDPNVKPGDQRKAAELTLKMAGELMTKTVHEHVLTLIRGLSDEELREVQAHRRWPTRIRDHLTKLGVPIEVAALPVP